MADERTPNQQVAQLLAFDAWRRSGEGRTVARICHHRQGLADQDAQTIFEAGWKAARDEPEARLHDQDIAAVVPTDDGAPVELPMTYERKP